MHVHMIHIYRGQNVYIYSKALKEQQKIKSFYSDISLTLIGILMWNRFKHLE